MAVRISLCTTLMKCACGSVGGWSVIQLRSQGRINASAWTGVTASKGMPNLLSASASSRRAPKRTHGDDGGRDRDEEVEKLGRAGVDRARIALERGHKDFAELSQRGHLALGEEARRGSRYGVGNERRQVQWRGFHQAAHPRYGSRCRACAAPGRVGGGVEGATCVVWFCPRRAWGLTDAANAAFTKSRRRMLVPSTSREDQ